MTESIKTTDRTPVSTRAILVRGADIGEDDRMLTFFTESHGVITLIGKSAKKSRKRFGGTLQRYLLLSISWIAGRGPLSILTSAAIEENFWGITADIRKAVAADDLLHIFSVLFPTPGPKNVEFDAIVRFLRAISSCEKTSEVSRKAEAILISMGGWEPRFSGCHGCGAIECESYWFDIPKSELWCAACHSPCESDVLLSGKAVKAWADFQSEIPETIGKIGAEDDVVAELEYPMMRYMEWHAGISKNQRSKARRLQSA